MTNHNAKTASHPSDQRSSTAGYTTTPGFDPVAGILAIILPGAGQFFQGEKKRGILIGASILGLFFGGMLIGGIDVVDSKSDRLWFLGQILVGPIALVTDSIHQSHFKGLDTQLGQQRTPLPDETIVDGKIVPLPAGSQPMMRKSLGKMNEIGMLYATIAGMLNLIVIIDAAFPTRVGKTKADTLLGGV